MDRIRNPRLLVSDPLHPVNPVKTLLAMKSRFAPPVSRYLFATNCGVADVSRQSQHSDRNDAEREIAQPRHRAIARVLGVGRVGPGHEALRTLHFLEELLGELGSVESPGSVTAR